MAERLSTQILNQQGARRVTVAQAGRFVNTFQDATGPETFLNAANIALADQQLVSGALNIEHFFVAKSFFMKNGVSEVVAISMAVLALDAAKVMGVSVMRALEPLDGIENFAMNFNTVVAGNYFRPASTKQTFLVPKENKDSSRSRDILA